MKYTQSESWNIRQNLKTEECEKVLYSESSFKRYKGGSGQIDR